MSHRAVTGRLATAETEDRSFEPRVCIFFLFWTRFVAFAKTKQFYLVPSACISSGRESPRRELSTGELLLSLAGLRG